ncbi:MAG: hypothetical protein Q3M24_01725 [Candidatus Electrothrix aestuarii]|uniref:Lipoprotein n=1 Tax=Candidatus Electrothrix aestuarii TaxID=3062594 RepID=A0AAU8LWE3_9BACT|nr:hypothetical protein [Candidatus Electrothrix aestuarii]
MKNKILILLVIAFSFFTGCAKKNNTELNLSEVERNTTLNTNQSSRTLAEKILQIVNRDPSSPLGGFLPKLKKITKKTAQILNNEAPYNNNEMSEYLSYIEQGVINSEPDLENVLENDVSFPSGKYHISNLSDKSKVVLKGFVRDSVFPLITRYRKKHPNEHLIVTIKTVGYADSSPPGGNLAALLDDKLPNLSKSMVERRKQRNKELSRLRAEIINDYILQEMNSELPHAPRIEIKKNIKGLGEELPYNEINYRERDDRRRICKAYVTVLKKNNF